MSSDSSPDLPPPIDRPTPATLPTSEPAPFAAYGFKPEPEPAGTPTPIPVSEPAVPAETPSSTVAAGTPNASEAWDVADDMDHSLDPNSVTIERVGSFIGSAILGLVLLAATIGGSIAASDYWPVFVGAWAALMLLFCAFSWFWPPIAYRHTSYRLSPRGLVIRRGVWWRSVAHVPRSRVQHTDVSQGPLQRYFSLGTLTVHTAGTEFASIPLEGLSREVADRIRDVLIDGGDDDGV